MRILAKGEPLLVLAGVYAVHFLLTRTSVAAGVPVPATRPFRAFPGHVLEGWDGIHYLRLAERFDSYSWPPLYPLALRAVGALLPSGSFVKAALLVNLAAHVAIVFLAYAFIQGHPRHREVPAWLFAALLLLFPGHNVFFAVYSESLFLALTLAVCVAWQRERLILAGLLCGFAVLVRNMGAFLGAALVAAELIRAVAERRLAPTRLLAAAAWVPFLAGWVSWLRFVGGTDPVAATAGWHEELLRVHLPPGVNPKLWALEYLVMPRQKEVVFLLATIAAAAYCWWRSLRVEALYIAFFLLSFAVYLYRPFPFTRYVSVLFPVALMAADTVRRFPPLQAAAVAVSAALAHHYEVLLFIDRAGEP